MVRSVIFLMMISIHLTAHVFSQGITLNMKHALLPDVFTSIENQTNYRFNWPDADWIKSAVDVNIKTKNTSFARTMELCLKDQPFTYKVINGTTIMMVVKDISGCVLTKDRDVLPGITVTIKGTCRSTTTNEKGEFLFENAELWDSLIVSGVNIQTVIIKIPSSHNPLVPVEMKVAVMPDFTLAKKIVNTGLQGLPLSKIGGSFGRTGNQLFDRPETSTVLGVLDGRVSGLLINKNIPEGANQPAVSVRGMSTIYASAKPLIILDNFPFDGDINNINTNDIQFITVLKDAAAASIWGVRAGNGVIVITTKKGNLNQPLKVEFNACTNFIRKPDLFYSRDIMSSADYIEFEKKLFGQGFYDPILGDPSHPAVSPAVEWMVRGRAGTVSNAYVSQRLDLLKNTDVRSEQAKYFYRSAVSQEVAVNISAGNSKNSSYIFLGYDRNPGNLVANDYERETVSLRDKYSIGKKLALTGAGMFMTSTTDNNSDGKFGIWYPYAQLADAGGKALAIPMDRRKPYTDTAGNGKLLDWDDKPLNELKFANNKTISKDLYLSLGLEYDIFQNLKLTLAAKYAEGKVHIANFHSLKTYFTRNKINSFAQINNGVVAWKLPLGNISDDGQNLYQSHNVRAQVDYNGLSKNGRHGLIAIAGTERPRVTTQTIESREYGISDAGQSDLIDYRPSFPMFYNPLVSNRIDRLYNNTSTVNNVMSYYSNVTYYYQNRYFLHGSARRDASNLFGVKPNQKWVPLWSLDAAWIISKEKFFHASWVDYLRLRLSDGYNGNVDNRVSALTTASPSGINSYNAATSTITNAPNPSLKWERTNMLNAGVDFSTRNSTVECSLDAFIKKGIDLIGDSPVDQTTGVATYRGNTASMISKGVEASVMTTAKINSVTWNVSFLFNYVDNKITHYGASQLPIAAYMDPSLYKPVEGYPLYALFGFRWKGLNHETGDPQGEWQKQVNREYTVITNTPERDGLVYVGPSMPNIFGNLRNTFTWKQLQVSVDISYKFRYFFRRSSINYNAVASGASLGNSDYKNRWQKPGDEKWTNVPSVPGQMDASRDFFYNYSEILITKGDHIRCQDIQLSYDLDRKLLTWLPFQKMKCYLNVYNPGILWKANKYGIDPDYVTTWPDPLRISAGVNIIL